MKPLKTLKLMIIDEKMRTIEIEINSLQFQSLGIDLSKVKEHEGKRELNNTITDFINKNNV